MLAHALLDPLQRRTSLARVFWLYGLGGSTAYITVGWLLGPFNFTGAWIYTILGVCVGALQSVMLWRCAFNCSSKPLGRLVRTSVVVGLVLVPAMIYFVITQPVAVGP